MDTVPPEILPGIQQFLDQDDLRRAAAVSRVFYGSAWLAGLFIPCQIYWYGEMNYDGELATLNGIVEHALLKDLRLGLSVATLDQTFWGGTVNPSRTPPEAVFRLISMALPVLHSLAIGTDALLFPSLTNALRFPAPNLRTLSLHVSGSQVPPLPDLPANILGGTSPNLRQIALHNVRLAGDAISAFSQASTVRLVYSKQNAQVDFALHFPRMLSLQLSFSKGPGSPTPIPYKLDVLGLHRLTFAEKEPFMLIPAILRCDTLERIPDIVYKDSCMQCGERLWQKSDHGPFSIRLSAAVNHGQLTTVAVVVVPDHRRWRRAFTLEDWEMPTQSPITAIPQVSARLSYLRMRNCFVLGLLESAGLDLNALRTLHIDFDAESPLAAELENGPFLFGPQDMSTPTFVRESYSHVSCSALRTLVLFAVSGTVNVNSQEVAFLGCALSQCTRPAQDRAALELAGIALKEPVAHTLLDQTFSAIRYDALAGRDVPAGCDDDFWGDELY